MGRRLMAIILAMTLPPLGGGAFGTTNGSGFVSSVQLSESYVPTAKKPFTLPQTEGLKLITDYKGLKEKDVTKPGAVDISAVGAEVTTKIGKGLTLTTTYVRSRSGLGARLYSEPEVLGLTLANSFAATPYRARGGAIRRYLTRSTGGAPKSMDKFAGAFRRYKIRSESKGFRVTLSYTQVDEKFTVPTRNLAKALQQGGLIAPVMAMRGAKHLELSVGGEIKGLKLTTSYERLEASNKKRVLIRRLGLSFGKEFEFAVGEAEVDRGFKAPPPLDKALATRVAGRSALGLGWMDRKGFRSVKAVAGLRESFRSLKLTPSFGLSVVHRSRELSLGGEERALKMAFEELSFRGALKLTREFRRVGRALPNVKVLGLSDWKLLNLLKGREREITFLSLTPEKGLSLTHKAHKLRWVGGDAVVSIGELRLGKALRLTRDYKRVSQGAPAPKQLALMLGFGKDRTYAGLAGKEREIVTAEFKPSKALGLTRRVETERMLADRLKGRRKEATTVRWAFSPRLTLTYLVESERGLNPEAHPLAKRTLGRVRLNSSEGWTVTVEAERVAREMRIRGRAPKRQGEARRRSVKVERALKGGKVTALLERRSAKGPKGRSIKTDIKDISVRTKVLGGLALTTRYREVSPESGPSQILREIGLQGPIRTLKGASFVAQFTESERGGRRERGLLRVALSKLKLGEGLVLTTEFKREEKGKRSMTTKVAKVVGRPFRGSGIKPIEGLTLTATYRSQKPSSGKVVVRRELKATLPLKDLLPLIGGRGNSKLTALIISEERGGRTKVHREFYLDTLKVALKPKSELGVDIGLSVGRAEREVSGREIPMSIVKFGGKLLGLKLTGEYAVGRKKAQRVVMKSWSVAGRIFGGLKLTASYRWNKPKGKKRLSVAQVPLEWQPGGAFVFSLAQDEKGKPKWSTTYTRRLDVQGRVVQEQYKVTYERAASGHFRGEVAMTSQYTRAKARRYELGLAYSKVISPERHELSLTARFVRHDFKAPAAKDKTDYEVTLTYRLPVSW